MKKILALFLIVSIFASSSSATFTRREKILSAAAIVGACAAAYTAALFAAIVNAARGFQNQLEDAQAQLNTASRLSRALSDELNLVVNGNIQDWETFLSRGLNMAQTFFHQNTINQLQRYHNEVADIPPRPRERLT
jgi:hypothetical protein